MRRAVTPSRPERITTRLQIAATAAAASLAIGAIAWATVFSPAFPFLPKAGNAEWIGPADRITTSAVGVDRAHPRSVRFQQQFRVENTTQPLVVELKAMRGFRLRFNGVEVASREAGSWNWKRGTRVDLGPPEAGDNRLEVDVVNSEGPPLLWLEARTPGIDLATGHGWLVQEGLRGPQRAMLADDTRRGAVGLGASDLGRILSDQADTLIAIATLCGLLSLAVRRLDGDRITPWLAPTAGTCVGLLWLGLFVFTISQLPAFHGYDGPDHLGYVRHLVEGGSLPLATDGPAMYHPPLFYLLSAGIWTLTGGPSTALHLLPFVSGLIQVAVAFALAKALFPARPALSALALLIAGILPINVVLASHFSNEPFHSAISACAILLTTQLLLAADSPLRRYLALGVVLGLALLTKVTSLLLLPLVAGFLAAKLWLADAPGSRRMGIRATAIVVPLCAIAGWYYLRNWLQLGRVAIGNWDVPGSAVAWWQYPGFHTAKYFTDFGESIQRPFFAGYVSFADGIYATFWGDSLLSGVSSVAVRHPFWNYEWMALVPLLALPATALLVGGVIALGLKSFRGPDLHRRAALAFVATTVLVYAFAVLFINIRLPFYAQAKASYALAALAPLAVGGAYAITEVHRILDAPGRRWLLVLFDAWLGTLAVALVLSFGA